MAAFASFILTKFFALKDSLVEKIDFWPHYFLSASNFLR